MARHGENIHKRQDGRWEGRYIKSKNSDGKAIWGYVYSFEEDEVPGYTMTDSAYDEKTYHATITNTHHPRLPDTGSTGDWMFVIIGVGILLLALSVPRKRKGREEAQS